ncbi:MAG: hypothetical protein LUF87_09125 [Alistipes sp.]|nr:hypothetical protein [Alistipes sp.]MCD7970500.1 hypothetical protein [Alistipes sp.]
MIELESSEKEISQEKVISEFTTVRAMKLLYFFCLSSVKADANHTDIGLFDHFDNFEAYARGPVEVDVYENRDHMYSFKFENGKLQDKRDSYSFSNFELIDNFQNDNEVDDRIPSYIRKFPAAMNKFIGTGLILKSTDELVNLSHDLLLWSYTDNSKMKVKDEDLVKIEYSWLEERLGKKLDI